MKKINENKYEFETACDFSCSGYVYAQEFIQKELNPDYDPKKNIYWVVKVASQNMADAIVLAYAVGGRVEIDFDHREDEWSLTGSYYNFTEKPHKEISLTVWSPGA